MSVKPKLIFLTLLLLSPVITAAELNGRFMVSDTDSSKLKVLLQINSTSGINALGGTTIVFGFDTAAINLTNNPVKNTDYIFHNFCGGNYSPATITKPMNNMIWVNIDLPFNNSSNGTIVSDTSGWTDVATIYFDILNGNGLASIYWLSNSPFWGTYKDDNLSILSPGSFQNIIYTLVPVELTEFKATQTGTNVQVTWTTAAEMNNKGFEVERKPPDKNVWETLAFINGNGTTTEIQNYSFIDDFKEQTLQGKVSYRLKQIDFYGRYYYSNVVEVEVDFAPRECTLYQNYPNPFNPSTKIRWESPEGHQSLKVYDILGNEVAILVDEIKPAGSFEVEFNSEDLASGVYIYRLQTAGFTETKKMILLR